MQIYALIRAKQAVYGAKWVETTIRVIWR